VDDINNSLCRHAEETYATVIARLQGHWAWNDQDFRPATPGSRQAVQRRLAYLTGVAHGRMPDAREALRATEAG